MLGRFSAATQHSRVNTGGALARLRPAFEVADTVEPGVALAAWTWEDDQQYSFSIYMRLLSSLRKKS